MKNFGVVFLVVALLVMTTIGYAMNDNGEMNLPIDKGKISNKDDTSDDEDISDEESKKDINGGVKKEKIVDKVIGVREMKRIALKNAFKALLRPVIHGWGIGYTCGEDEEFLKIRFHVSSVRTLPRKKIVSAIGSVVKDVKVNKEGLVRLRERLKEVIEKEGKVVKKGRIVINGEKYLLTNIQKEDDALKADIKEGINYSECKLNNISVEDCENNAETVGSIEITKRTKTNLKNEPIFWAGSMNFKDKKYRVVFLAYPQGPKISTKV